MADSEVTASLKADGGSAVLRMVLGDGVPGYWTVTLHKGSTLVRRWEGVSDDALPDEVSLPVAALSAPHTSLSWSVVLYGPAHEVPYHVRVELDQGRRSILDDPIRLRGTVPARKTRTLSGTIEVEPG
ncbi:MAG: hypothetical protein H6739_31150 [Alphaproteobacteria bacterium]|nr:hypothetical protein [Alphaproteobacteria bacterium]